MEGVITRENELPVIKSLPSSGCKMGILRRNRWKWLRETSKVSSQDSEKPTPRAAKRGPHSLKSFSRSFHISAIWLQPDPGLDGYSLGLIAVHSHHRTDKWGQMRKLRPRKVGGHWNCTLTNRHKSPCSFDFPRLLPRGTHPQTGHHRTVTT